MRLKRVFDLLIVFVSAPLWLPLMLLGAVLVRLTLGSPVLFKQLRPGYREELFTMYKFRTMSDDRDSSGHLLPDARRLRAFGKWLRKTSIDELPELLNVIRGDMSLVGPRPLLVQYLERYSPEQRRRHDVLPGLTGWAQVNGRNAISWEDKFRLDVWYVDHQNIFLDCRILALSFTKIVRQDGISAPGEATMPEFKGSAVTRE